MKKGFTDRTNVRCAPLPLSQRRVWPFNQATDVDMLVTGGGMSMDLDATGENGTFQFNNNKHPSAWVEFKRNVFGGADSSSPAVQAQLECYRWLRDWDGNHTPLFFVKYWFDESILDCHVSEAPPEMAERFFRSFEFWVEAQNEPAEQWVPPGRSIKCNEYEWGYLLAEVRGLTEPYKRMSYDRLLGPMPTFDKPAPGAIDR